MSGLPAAPAAPTSMPDGNAASLARFERLLREAIAAGSLLKLVLVHYQGGQDLIDAQGPDVQRVWVRVITLRDEPHLSVLLRYPTRDITKNWPLSEGLGLVVAWLAAGAFRNAHLHTPAEEVQLAFSKKGKASVRVGKPSNAKADPPGDAAAAGAISSAHGKAGEATAGHNRDKHRFLSLSRPFLRALGVTDANGQLIPAMSRKWKQINKFVEVFSHALARSALKDQQALHVVDFGSGKGYLTFAIHDWLRHTLQRDAQVTGVELRGDLVQLCQGVIDQLQLQGMGYEQGDVRHYHPSTLHVMIALHACDVATDHAIHLGIRAGADIIMCSPCCHKQLRPQLLSPHPLKPILQHGIHLGQQAEMLTDGLRAMLLDAAGYDTQVFEFISLEHTNKNKMILAVKRAAPAAGHAAAVLGQVHDIKALYGIQDQCLEALLRADGLLP